MQRTITVKGTGTAKAAPDQVRIILNLEATDPAYEGAMRIAEKQIETLKETLATVGFDRKSLKTMCFDVSADYEREKDNNGNYKRVFNGYTCSHRLKLEFDFDIQHLGKTLSAIAFCLAEPDLSIGFTIKEPNGIRAELLRNAAENAREKAEILCSAAQVKLGELLTIDYHWGELELISNTDYRIADRCMAIAAGHEIDIEPEDISLSDTVTFVWEID